LLFSCWNRVANEITAVLPTENASGVNKRKLCHGPIKNYGI